MCKWHVVFIAVVLLAVGAVLVPSQFVDAGGGGWRPVEGGPNQNQNGDWLIQAEHVDGNGTVDGTVTTGTTGGRRAARRAAKDLAESLNDAGESFKWDPSCDSPLFNC
jgi:hypothetical protein